MMRTQKPTKILVNYQLSQTFLLISYSVSNVKFPTKSNPIGVAPLARWLIVDRVGKSTRISIRRSKNARISRPEMDKVTWSEPFRKPFYGVEGAFKKPTMTFKSEGHRFALALTISVYDKEMYVSRKNILS